MSLLNMLLAANTGDRVKIVKPSITDPVNDAQDVDPEAPIQSSAFATTGGTTTHASSDWELSLNPEFTMIVASSYNDTENKTSWSPTIPT